MGRKGLGVIAALAVAVITVAMALHSVWGGGVANERVSVTNLGAEATGNSTSAAISPDGRYVAFISSAENLVPGDNNRVRDVFVRDRLLGTTERISVASDGTQGDGQSSGLATGAPALSGDARFVAFASSATNLVANDMNNLDDIFVRDRLLGTTERISVASDGSEGNDVSTAPSISSDARYVTFSSMANNLIAGDANNDRDIFLHDRTTGSTELISVASDGTHGNFSSGGFAAGSASITSNGRFIVYGSFANNLVANDVNGWDDVFVRDRVAGTTERASVSSAGVEGNGHSVHPSISDDGRYVVFSTLADNLGGQDGNPYYDLYLRDRQTGTTTRLSAGPGGEPTNGHTLLSSISDDGRFIAYESSASNLVPNDVNGSTDIFELDTQNGELVLVSRSFKGVNANGASGFPAVSNLGLNVAFESFAVNLVPEDDSNNGSDIFVRGPLLGPTPTPRRTATRTPTATPTRTPTPARCPLSIGDVDANGAVNSVDALFVLQFVADLLGSLPNSEKADVNGDGRITSVDAAVILQFTAGLLSCLPP